MRRLNIREFRAALTTLDDEVEIVRNSHTVGYFIPVWMVRAKDIEKMTESVTLKEIEKRIGAK